MVNAQSITDLLSAAGPLDDTVSAIVQRGASDWTIRFEDIDLYVDLNEQTGRLTWQCDLGTVASENRPEIYQAFLRYNFLSPDTGGVLLALNGDVAVLIVGMVAEGLTAETSAAIMVNFASKARIWREIMVDGLSAVTPATVDPLAFGIRA